MEIFGILTGSLGLSPDGVFNGIQTHTCGHERKLANALLLRSACNSTVNL